MASFDELKAQLEGSFVAAGAAGFVAQTAPGIHGRAGPCRSHTGLYSGQTGVFPGPSR